MDLITGYAHTRYSMRRDGFGRVGMNVVNAIDRARRARRPARSTLFDDQADPTPRSGAAATGSYQTGLFGEEAVADALQRDGWKILGHRVKTHVGELDLIARRGDTVVFVEVKTAGPRRFAVEESISARQRLRCRRAAVAWMSNNRALQKGVRSYRFDVFLVHRDDDGSIIRIDHVRDAF